jgi:dipeptidyl-peptidase-4
MGAPEASFPRQQARTRRFSLGAPRSFTVAPDGERVVFLRSPAGDNPFNSLWVYETATGTEREVASAPSILGSTDEDLPAEERARRERARELAGGIVGYACDDEVRHAAFSLGGRLWWVAVDDGAGSSRPIELPCPGGVFDPRPGPTGRRVAFLAGPRLLTVATTGTEPYAVLAEEQDEAFTWGAAEFIAAEEMGRGRGFWWAPDGGSVLAARVDNSPVATWWTADPSTPARTPEAHRYPAAGTADAMVTLWHLPVEGSGEPRRQVRWDAERYPYLATVRWSGSGPPLLVVEQRDHKACEVLAVDLGSGSTAAVAGAEDSAWVDWPPGVPAWLDDGQLVWAASDSATWRLRVGRELVTPPGLQVREVTSVGASVVFTASSQPEVVEAWEWSSFEGLRQLTDVGGISSALGQGRARVVVARSMDWHGPRAEVVVDRSAPQALASKAEAPVVDPVVRFLRAGRRDLSVGVVLPTGHTGGPLPVIMAPYGGPGHQMVVASRSAWLEAQWFADQGFAIVVADGRGTPGRGPDFERQVYLDLAQPVLEDQVEALWATAEQVPELDLSRVGIRGWSFGGYLSALAVLARPDVFHAAVAGAPVTDWRLYDTYYSERFLGHPDAEPGAYQHTSLLPLAPQLRRPLLLVHGLADDNVYAVHTLELSSALLVAGRPHTVLPLPGVTHVASRQDVTESLLWSELEFFRRALAGPAPATGPEG